MSEHDHHNTPDKYPASGHLEHRRGDSTATMTGHERHDDHAGHTDGRPLVLMKVTVLMAG